MKVKFLKKAYLKFRYFIDECPAEISGFGKVREVEGEEGIELEVYDIEILPQKVTAAHASIEEKTLAEFLADKMRRGKSTKPYKLWWHSHCDFSSFFSNTDETTINESTEFPYLLSIVGNKKLEIEARLDIYQPLRVTIPVELEIETEVDEKLRNLCKKEIDKKVEIKQSKTKQLGFDFKEEDNILIKEPNLKPEEDYEEDWWEKREPWWMKGA